MKKHEACFHLNKIIDDMRSRLAHYKESRDDPPKETVDRQTKEKRAATEVEIADHVRFLDREIREYEQALEALDMAATALTK
jgi:hypothetical protein